MIFSHMEILPYNCGVVGATLVGIVACNGGDTEIRPEPDEVPDFEEQVEIGLGSGGVPGVPLPDAEIGDSWRIRLCDPDIDGNYLYGGMSSVAHLGNNTFFTTDARSGILGLFRLPDDLEVECAPLLSRGPARNLRAYEEDRILSLVEEGTSDRFVAVEVDENGNLSEPVADYTADEEDVDLHPEDAVKCAGADVVGPRIAAGTLTSGSAIVLLAKGAFCNPDDPAAFGEVEFVLGEVEGNGIAPLGPKLNTPASYGDFTSNMREIGADLAGDFAFVARGFRIDETSATRVVTAFHPETGTEIEILNEDVSVPSGFDGMDEFGWPLGATPNTALPDGRSIVSVLVSRDGDFEEGVEVYGFRINPETGETDVMGLNFISLRAEDGTRTGLATPYPAFPTSRVNPLIADLLSEEGTAPPFWTWVGQSAFSSHLHDMAITDARGRVTVQNPSGFTVDETEFTITGSFAILDDLQDLWIIISGFNPTEGSISIQTEIKLGP